MNGPFSRGFRRRLALAFVAVAGVSSALLAVGATITVTSYRYHSFRERARSETAEDIARFERPTPAGPVARLEGSEQVGGPDVVVVDHGQATTSVEGLDVADVPSAVRAEARRHPGRLAEGTAIIGGDPFFVLGSKVEDGAEVYFLHPQRELQQGLNELRVTLFLGWMIVVVGAAFVGAIVARRTLRPVQAAADAARSVTEGLLDTRLEVGADDEFGQWARSFNEMVAALEDKIWALERARDRERRFNADVAHELRTPLGSLVAAATLVEDRYDDLAPHLRRPAELVVEGARRMHRLVEELLELHRLEAGQEVVDASEVDLSHAVVEALAAHGWEDEVGVVFDEHPVLQTDRRRIDRILANLVGNGLDHGGGDVTVTVSCEGAHAVVAVADRGPGIAPEDLERIFDRHFKADPARAGARRGSGLGLAIASEQAKVLGGELDVASVPGQGATFRLRLPLHRSPGPPAVRAASRKVP